MSVNRAVIKATYDDWFYRPVLLEYAGCGLSNYGLWTRRIRSQREASENLVDTLIGAIPKPLGRVLDVACGRGESSRRLLERHGANAVVGINLSLKQLAAGGSRPERASFVGMDAARLGLRDESFDHILCVEAAFHFDTRRRFLEETRRVLRPGGCLALSDILFRRFYSERSPFSCAANFLPDGPSYESLMRDVGFSEVDVRDVTGQAWGGYRRHAAVELTRLYARHEGVRAALRFLIWLVESSLVTRRYLLVTAIK